MGCQCFQMHVQHVLYVFPYVQCVVGTCPMCFKCFEIFVNVCSKFVFMLWILVKCASMCCSVINIVVWCFYIWSMLFIAASMLFNVCQYLFDAFQYVVNVCPWLFNASSMRFNVGSMPTNNFSARVLCCSMLFGGQCCVNAFQIREWFLNIVQCVSNVI